MAQQAECTQDVLQRPNTVINQPFLPDPDQNIKNYFKARAVTILPLEQVIGWSAQRPNTTVDDMLISKIRSKKRSIYQNLKLRKPNSIKQSPRENSPTKLPFVTEQKSRNKVIQKHNTGSLKKNKISDSPKSQLDESLNAEQKQSQNKQRKGLFSPQPLSPSTRTKTYAQQISKKTTDTVQIDIKNFNQISMQERSDTSNSSDQQGPNNSRNNSNQRQFQPSLKKSLRRRAIINTSSRQTARDKLIELSKNEPEQRKEEFKLKVLSHKTNQINDLRQFQSPDQLDNSLGFQASSIFSNNLFPDSTSVLQQSDFHFTNRKKLHLGTTFNVCCFKRQDQPQNEIATIHFHEGNGLSHNRRPVSDMCTAGDGKIFSLVEMAIEAAHAKVIKDYGRYRKLRPFLLKYRILIESELSKMGQGINPQPYIVMEKLLKPVDPLDQQETFHDQAILKYTTRKSKSPKKIKKSEQIVKILNGFGGMKSIWTNQNDWYNAPIYQQEIEGLTQLEATLLCLSEDQIVRLANLSRDPEDPHCYTNQVLLDNTLKRAADLTELQYWNKVLFNKKFPQQELNSLFERGCLTLLIQLALIGRMNKFDKFVQTFQNGERIINNQQVIQRLYKKCLSLHYSIEAVKEIYRALQKHKQVFVRLCELGIEQNNDKFNKEKVQQLIDFFIEQGARLCQLVTSMIKQDLAPLFDQDGDQEIMIFGGKDIRQQVKDDAQKVNEILRAVCTIPQFSKDGQLI